MMNTVKMPRISKAWAAVVVIVSCVMGALCIVVFHQNETARYTVAHLTLETFTPVFDLEDEGEHWEAQGQDKAQEQKDAKDIVISHTTGIPLETENQEVFPPLEEMHLAPIEPLELSAVGMVKVVDVSKAMIGNAG